MVLARAGRRRWASGMSVAREIPASRTALAYPALHALRPHAGDEAELVRHVDEVLRPAGYRLVGAFPEGASAAASVAGFRVAHSLAWGRHLYVDDLSTVPEARGRGHARAVMEWVAEEARRQGCGQLHLDSGVGPQRAAAHRLYLNCGLLITAHHFARGVR